ncbi:MULTISPECIES: hypothetical protein [unclassified Wolbachia]|uniref:hypothetical protein n=1 Tax=unclassified Wolbachia TaxID=2640676 RepID=UPI003132E0F7
MHDSSPTSYRRGISDPANKQRDDDCQGVIQVASFLSSQCPDTGIQFHLMMVSFQCPDTGFYPKGCHPSAQTLGSHFTL